MRIITLCDNYQYDRALKAGPGFSCLVQVGGKNILFDTGAHSQTLLYNMQKLGIGPESMTTIVLSHIDSDHVGGLFGILERNSDVTVYLPSSFPAAFKDKVKSCGAEVVEVSGAVQIAEGVESTGELGTWIKEQALMIRSGKGIIIVVGCSHPGIVNIVERAKEITDDKIYLVLGGLHLGTPSEAISITESLLQLGVEKIGPCHCTAEDARRLLKEKYKERFIENGVGKVTEG